MPEGKEEAIIYRVVDEAYNKGNLAVLDETTDPNFSIHWPEMEFKGLETYKQFIIGMRVAFPDLQFKIDDLFVKENKASIRYTMSGTHQGEFMGIAPTGKKISIQGISITRFDNEKQAETWGIMDNLGLMKQMGILPFPA